MLHASVLAEAIVVDEHGDDSCPCVTAWLDKYRQPAFDAIRTVILAMYHKED
jgi:hypothetical protein